MQEDEKILADTKTHFAVNAEVYTGKNPTEDRTRFTHPTHVVLRLVEPIVNTNRNITGDNWYTSVELADALRSKGLTYVGTMKKNKRAIPPQFLPNRTRQTDSSLFGFTAQNTIVSYVPRRGKSVVLLSTMHHNASVDGSTKKPEIILYYNGTKGGVDALDEKCARYSTSRRTRRWPMVLFHAILDIAGVNARILYQFAQAGEFISRSSYLKELGRQLYTPYVTARISNQNVPRKIRMKAADILKLHLEESSIPLEMPQRSKRPRCRICPPNKDRKTSNHYKTAIFKNFTIRISPPNNCCYLKSGDIILESDITFCGDDTHKIIYRKFLNKTNLYDTPCCSSELGIFQVLKDELGVLEITDIGEVDHKCIIFDLPQKCAVFPLVHTV
nr:unnamed protein product [Callosobruchus chinensis]